MMIALQSASHDRRSRRRACCVSPELLELRREHTPQIAKLSSETASRCPSHELHAAAVRLCSWADSINGRIAGIVAPTDSEPFAGSGLSCVEALDGMRVRRVDAENGARAVREWLGRGELDRAYKRLMMTFDVASVDWRS